ncbi:hypothetical protein BJ944DRAFT_229908 [Cunninghamella echinulata]|nr:hypothetical protein BJ944DRAFT_229908 [Cunninghamella echinulata]
MNINHSKESLILLIEQINIKLAEKEEENRHLRARAYDWKKKYLENESIYQSLIKQYEEREKQILADHENQMNALTTAHVEKMNDMSALILKLQEQLNHQSHFYDHHSISSSPYSHNDSDNLNNIAHNIEDIHILTDPMTIHHRDKATDLILNMNDLMIDIETRINDYIAVNHLNEEDSSDEFETSTSSEEEGEESSHVYDIEEENIIYPVKLRPLSLSSATSSILPPLPLLQQQHVLEKEEEKGKDIAIDKHRYSYHSSNNNNHSNPSSNNNHNSHNNNSINNMNTNINNNINDDNDDVHSYTSSIHRYPSTNELYKKKNRSSFSLFSSQHHHQQQQQQQQQQQKQQQQQSNPILHSKPTLENLSKVIPNFLLKKQTKSEQWKISHRHSFIDKRT